MPKLSCCRMIWLLARPLPPPLSLDRQHTGSLRKRDNLLTGEGGEGYRRGVESRKKAWASINQSILSGIGGWILKEMGCVWIRELWIRIGFIADPDPAFFLHSDLDTDPGSQTNADPDPDPSQTSKSQKFEFLLEKYT